MTTTIVDLVERNNSLSESQNVRAFADILKAGRAGDTKIMVANKPLNEVACLDPRCNPTEFFNLDGYEAIVHRNAGGNVRHALRDILMLDRALQLHELAIVHHTDCGTLTSTDEQVRSHVKARVDEVHWAEVDAIEWGSMTDVEESIKGDVKWFRENPLVRAELKDGCRGFVLDSQTGKVRKVDV
ncbi:hypothetical protein OQA88_4621 [Cercophora sp. LCS_1]